MTHPYGTWPSPISAEDVAASSLRLDGARYVGDEVWWGQALAAEGGRGAVFREGSDVPVLPAPWSARSRVHEYGGGAWTATPDGVLLFVEASDQRVYALDADAAEPRPLTPEAPASRYGGLVLSGGELLAVRETHTDAVVPSRDIVAIALDGSGVRSLVAGSDFLSQPRLSPDGSQLAWIAWDHPSMPWDDAELRVGHITDAGVTTWDVLSRQDATQVEWTGPRELLFSDDPTGRWNLYRSAAGAVTPVSPADADTGGPQWVLGSSWFRPLSDGRIVAVRTNGTDELVLIGTDAAGSVTVLDVPLTAGIQTFDVRATTVLLTGSSSLHPSGVWELDVDDPSSLRRVVGGTAPWDASWLPVAREVTYPGRLGDVHAFDYPPTNPDVTADPDERAPYVVLAHGGPTSHVAGEVSPAVAFFTSRGIGVLDVNYGGSTGYGRAYRERLRNSWGVVDVDDVLSAATGLASSGAADPARLAIRGGSAGGLTVLGALARGDVFAAGIDRYGVTDLRSLATDTHDFESRYLDGLIGRWPEDEAVYIERSPVTHVSEIHAPVLILQGDQDPVVPPNQSEALRDALVANGVPHKYVLFAGESHGFRQRETIVAAAELELAFLGAVFDFTPADARPLTLD
ncbi:S9 family peptidase [Microbacterium gorillae]|uniref:S9 family peptidase n=1 Tax=Microbacterium gorillae TaxID=1231063 RepID=UPI00058FF0FC|nr:prolyl oligopeptidase family serine peptidase [Microbacterium gorillae]